jgi:uncharacterized protein (TIGR02145 family)
MSQIKITLIMERFLFFIIVFALVLKVNAQQTKTFTDPRDGITYKTVNIGNQTWMAENLAYKPDSRNYWAYDNDQSNVAKYGYLYNWQASKIVCPTGWILPSISDFETLLSNFDATDNAYPELKDGGSSGFNAILGGRRYNDGSFNDIDSYGYWWSATEYGNRHARSLSLSLSISDQPVGIGIGHVALGYAVRCLKE